MPTRTNPLSPKYGRELVDEIKTKKAIRLLQAGATPVMVAQQLNVGVKLIRILKEKMEEDDDE